MADYTQTQNTIISHQAANNEAGGGVEGTPVDVRTALSCLIILRHAYIEAVDPGGKEPEFHIMASLDQTASPPDESWFRVLTIKANDPGAAPTTQTLGGTEAVGSTSLGINPTAGYAEGEEIYVRDTTTEADSEWHIIAEVVTNVSLEIFMGLTNAKDSADVIWSDAQTYRVPLDLAGIGHINVNYSNEIASGTNTAIFVEALVATDFV